MKFLITSVFFTFILLGFSFQTVEGFTQYDCTSTLVSSFCKPSNGQVPSAILTNSNPCSNSNCQPNISPVESCWNCPWNIEETNQEELAEKLHSSINGIKPATQNQAGKDVQFSKPNTAVNPSYHVHVMHSNMPEVATAKATEITGQSQASTGGYHFVEPAVEEIDWLPVWTVSSLTWGLVVIVMVSIVCIVIGIGIAMTKKENLIYIDRPKIEWYEKKIYVDRPVVKHIERSDPQPERTARQGIDAISQPPPFVLSAPPPIVNRESREYYEGRTRVTEEVTTQESTEIKKIDCREIIEIIRNSINDENTFRVFTDWRKKNDSKFQEIMSRSAIAGGYVENIADDVLQAFFVARRQLKFNLKEKNLKCSFCNIQASNEIALTRHMGTAHPNQQEELEE